MIVAEGADYGGRSVIKTDMKTGKSYILAGLFEGRPFNSPNDITIDEKGRIYFSDPRYLGHEPIDQHGFGRLSHRSPTARSPHHHRRRQAQRRAGLARPEDAVRRQQRQRLVRVPEPEGRREDAAGPPSVAGLRRGRGRQPQQPPRADRLHGARQAVQRSGRHGCRLGRQHLAGFALRVSSRACRC